MIGLLLMALVSLMTIALANGTEIDNTGAPCDCDGIDPAAPVLLMSADVSSVTFENVGTARMDIGTGQIVKADGTVLKTLPFTVILDANPYTFTKNDALIPHNSKVTYPITGVQPGDELALKFNVGFKAKCTVA
jgi:hypothetical protein